MNWFQSTKEKLKEQLRIVATNPDNFELKWTFTTSRIRLYSLAFIAFIVSGIVFSLFISFGIFSSQNDTDSTTENRQQLERQYEQIQSLTKKIEAQENYIENIKKVISGTLPIDSVNSDLPDPQKIIQPRLNSRPTENEKALKKEMKR